MTYDFTLFVAGKETIKNQEIVDCIKAGLNERLKASFDLLVVDVVDSPELAFREQIFVTPSWVRNLPAPKKKIVGNFCIDKNISRALDIFLK